jgi:hypothetical protein
MWQIDGMKPRAIKLHDVVALLEERPSDGLAMGQVGTVVEMHSPEALEVEFLNSSGRTIALLPLKRADVLVLRHDLTPTAV